MNYDTFINDVKFLEKRLKGFIELAEAIDEVKILLTQHNELSKTIEDQKKHILTVSDVIAKQKEEVSNLEKRISERKEQADSLEDFYHDRSNEIEERIARLETLEDKKIEETNKKAEQIILDAQKHAAKEYIEANKKVEETLKRKEVLEKEIEKIKKRF